MHHTDLFSYDSWYAVAYDSDIVEGPKLFGVSIFDEPLVLYRDKSGALQCVSDFCPHRASKLSEGQASDVEVANCDKTAVQCSCVGVE